MSFQFSGLWHQIASYETEGVVGNCHRTTYTVTNQNGFNIANYRVINTALDIVYDTATLASTDGSARLNVNLMVDNEMIQTELWVLATDYQNYALTYTCRNVNENQMRVWSWKMTRSRRPSPAAAESGLNDAVNSLIILNDHYYQVADQSDESCFYYPEHVEDQPVVFRGTCDQNIPVVENFDAERYMGVWHEIESYPSVFQTGTCNNARYTLTDAGVEVYNTQVVGQQLDYIYGSAALASPDDGLGKLVVSFPIAGTNQTTQTDYWVLATDYDSYALVYTCSQIDDEYRSVWSWKLSRTKELSAPANDVMNNIINSIPVLDNRYYQIRDQTPEGCFFYPEPVEGQPVVFPGQCDETIQAAADFQVSRFGGVWYEIAAYTKLQTGVCVNFDCTNTAANTFDMTITSVINDFREIITGSAVRSVNDGTGKFQLSLNIGGEATPMPYWILTTDYDNYALAYSCVNVDEHWRRVFSWKLSRSSEGLSTTANQAMDEIISSIQVLGNEYYETTDQSEYGCFFLPDIPAGQPVIIEGQCDTSIAVVQNFDPFRYEGLWRNIESYAAEFEDGTCNEATYTIDTNGEVIVYNTQVLNQALDDITGRAALEYDDGSAKLIVTFEVGGFNVYSWKLSRTRELTQASVEAIDEAMSRVRVLNQRFYTRRLHSDDDCFYYPDHVEDQPVTFRGVCDQTIPVVQNFNAERRATRRCSKRARATTRGTRSRTPASRCTTRVVGQQLDYIYGSAALASPDDGLGKLVVSFPIAGTNQTTQTDYWVLATDYDNYALVYTCAQLEDDRRGVWSWKLSRTKQLSNINNAIMNDIIDSIPVLDERYYQIRDQTPEGCFFYPEPVLGEPVVFPGQCNENIEAVPDFDLNRFAGVWSEIAAYPYEREGDCTILDHTSTSNNAFSLRWASVVNEFLDASTSNVVRTVNDNSAKFDVDLVINGIATTIPYWILATDYDNYALVYSCVNIDEDWRRVRSWKLSRSRSGLSADAENAINQAMSSIEVLSNDYFETTDQSDDACFYLPDLAPGEPVILNGQCDLTIPVEMNFDPSRYEGLWRNIESYAAEFEDGTCNEANYTINSSGEVIVYNTQVVNQTLDDIYGRATLQYNDGSVKLLVTFEVGGINVTSTYWVLRTDYISYSLVYSCSNVDDYTMRVYSWKLSRTRELSNSAIQAMDEVISRVRVLNERFYTRRLHSDEDCFYFPVPVYNEPVTFRGLCDQSIQVQQNFDAARYMGVWHEIESYPSVFQTGTCNNARYTLTDAGVEVYNTQVVGQRLDYIYGSAALASPDDGLGKLVVSFPLAGTNWTTDTDYWVLGTDYDNYALVYTCAQIDEDRRGVWSWKLSRRKQLTQAENAIMDNIIASIPVLDDRYYQTRDQTPEGCFFFPEPILGQQVVFPGQCDESIQAVPNFDINRFISLQFSGVWSEVAAYPYNRNGECPSFDYSSTSANSFDIKLTTVVDYFLDSITSGAIRTSNDNSAKFEIEMINQDGTVTRIPYWILATDYDNYALAYSCINIDQDWRQVYSWKLSRDRSGLNSEANQAINEVISSIQVLADQYYEDTDQSDDACFFLPDVPAGEPVIIDGPCDPTIPVMENFNPIRYQGLWRSIESYASEFEGGACNEAIYTLGVDGVVNVFNTQVVDQTLDTISGTAVLDGDDGSARLIVSFPIGDTNETTQSNYWILDTDYDSYSLVYSCANLPDGNRRVYSWKLSRERELSVESTQAINEVIGRVRELNERFYIQRIHSDDDCFFYPEPVPGEPVVFRGQCDENIQVLQNLDVGRYLGTWYDVESYPQPFQQGTCPIAYYSAGEEGVDVYNTQVVAQQLDEIRGTAVPASGDGEGKLIVSFPIAGTNFTTESDYWILDTDYDNYALVYSCRNLDGDERVVSSWKLSRTPTLDASSTSIINGIMDTIPVLRQQYYEERGHTEEDCFFYPDNNGEPVVLEGQCETEDEIQIVTDFNPSLFAGTWREIARFPFEHQTGQCANGGYEYNAATNTFSMTHTIVHDERMSTVLGEAQVASGNRGILISTFPNENGVYSWKLGRGTALSGQANEAIDSIVSSQMSLFEGYYEYTDQSDDACFHYPEFVDPPFIELPGLCDGTIRAKPDFDFAAYLGLWHEVARFPQPFQVGECARADYSLVGDVIDVVNTVVDQQQLETVLGTATIVPTEDNSGLLEVTFIVNGVPNVANYYVLETDYTNFALVYSCRNTDTNSRIVSSWKLSRQRNYDSQFDAIMDPIIENTQGLLEDYYIYSDQSDEACFYIPELDPNQPVLFRGQCDESLTGVPNFNMQQYLGWWHEIEHYPYGFPVGTCLSTRYQVSGNQFSAVHTSVTGLTADVTTTPVQVSAAYPGRLRKTLSDGQVVGKYLIILAVIQFL
ncbi:Apolipoprotein D [Eumeta japonica]|uniref:Apolipoprotein D n=1 Tax=Eumeta variegata TaxID=151549 RepID=A0A4C1TV79_EUMVA|nr:Apolipoprotein D [Eumeta japonica]